ncbi:signal peptidase I [Actinoplanes sp. NPDC024001]|uniref:signal peptidase I n=1 Tax=Actinoplanes sp. NPDC024001 TaxID=3154598 RepID=UPI0033D6CA67
MRNSFLLVGLVSALIAGGSCGAGDQKRYRIQSISMAPTFEEGAVVRAAEVESGAYRPRAGDIVAFQPPGSWGEGTVRVYRVVAVPGDTISCCDARDRLVRNGAALDEPHVNTDGEPPVAFDATTVPAGHVFVLGDNRGVANDSSHNGPLPVANVVGVVQP